MLIAFLALLAMLNGGLAWLGAPAGIAGLSLQGMVGVVVSPVAWAIGVPWTDARVVGEFIGVKTVLNEFVAFCQLADLLRGSVPLRPCAAALSMTVTFPGRAGEGLRCPHWSCRVTELRHDGLLARERVEHALMVGVRPLVVPRIVASDPLQELRQHRVLRLT